MSNHTTIASCTDSELRPPIRRKRTRRKSNFELASGYAPPARRKADMAIVVIHTIRRV